uniref:URB1 C-terminal domain-containing protein n=1 Tax=Pinguiococcus pyrenoidosus TaxID=172671 RepID=A0A7R9UCB5_9STRA
MSAASHSRDLRKVVLRCLAGYRGSTRAVDRALLRISGGVGTAGASQTGADLHLPRWFAREVRLTRVKATLRDFGSLHGGAKERSDAAREADDDDEAGKDEAPLDPSFVIPLLLRMIRCPPEEAHRLPARELSERGCTALCLAALSSVDDRVRKCTQVALNEMEQLLAGVSAAEDALFHDRQQQLLLVHTVNEAVQQCLVENAENSTEAPSFSPLAALTLARVSMALSDAAHPAYRALNRMLMSRCVFTDDRERSRLGRWDLRQDFFPGFLSVLQGTDVVSSAGDEASTALHARTWLLETICCGLRAQLNQPPGNTGADSVALLERKHVVEFALTFLEGSLGFHAEDARQAAVVCDFLTLYTTFDAGLTDAVGRVGVLPIIRGHLVMLQNPKSIALHAALVELLRHLTRRLLFTTTRVKVASAIAEIVQGRTCVGLAHVVSKLGSHASSRLAGMKGLASTSMDREVKLLREALRALTESLALAENGLLLAALRDVDELDEDRSGEAGKFSELLDDFFSSCQVATCRRVLRAMMPPKAFLPMRQAAKPICDNVEDLLCLLFLGAHTLLVGVRGGEEADFSRLEGVVKEDLQRVLTVFSQSPGAGLEQDRQNSLSGPGIVAIAIAALAPAFKRLANADEKHRLATLLSSAAPQLCGYGPALILSSEPEKKAGASADLVEQFKADLLPERRVQAAPDGLVLCAGWCPLLLSDSTVEGRRLVATEESTGFAELWFKNQLDHLGLEKERRWRGADAGSTPRSRSKPVSKPESSRPKRRKSGEKQGTNGQKRRKTR